MNTQTHIGSVCLIAFVLLHFGAAVAPAQSLVSLSGVATDPTQAVLPGVEVTAVNNSTHLRRTAVTNESGWYSFPILLPGSYTVTATRVGFNTRVFPAVELPVKESVSLDLPMEVGKVLTTVDVTTSLSKTNAQVGNTFDQRTIRDLPLQTGNTPRNSFRFTCNPVTMTSLSCRTWM